MDVDKYLRICYELGEEPDPAKMPPDPSDFPEEVQVAFLLSGYLEDRWDGTSGSYLGKNYSILEYLFSIYNIESPIIILFFIKLWDNVVTNDRAQRAEHRRKSNEKKASAGGGKNFTHNVKG